MTSAIIGAGLIGVAALGAAKLINNNMKSVKTVEASSEIVATIGEIRGIISSPLACFNSFSGLNGSNSSNLTIKDSIGRIKFNSGNNIPGSKVKITNIQLNDSNSSVSITPGGKGDTFLEITFQKGKGTLGGHIKKRIKVLAETDTSSLIGSCRAVNGGESSLWDRSSVDYNDIYFQGGNVGIGTNEPKSELDITGGLKLGNIKRLCNNSTRGTIYFDYYKRRLRFCDGKSWLIIATLSPYIWINVSSPTESHSTACSRIGASIASDQGYGICASGESRPSLPLKHGRNPQEIKYSSGTWGGVSKGGTPHGIYCYKSGQKRDNDGSDRRVAWLCRE